MQPPLTSDELQELHSWTRLKVISDTSENARLPFLFQVQDALLRQWRQFRAQRSGGRRSNRATSSAPAAAALAEAGDIPVYICHQEPRNEPANDPGEEGAEAIPMEVIEQQESSAWMWRKYNIVITDPSPPGSKTDHAFKVISILPGANISFVRIIKWICPLWTWRKFYLVLLLWETV